MSETCRGGVGEVSQKHPQVSQIDQMNKIQGFGAIPDTLATPLRHHPDTIPTPKFWRYSPTAITIISKYPIFPDTFLFFSAAKTKKLICNIYLLTINKFYND